RVEVEVAFLRPVEIRLLQDQRHTQEALPEVNGGLAAGADERDVVDALHGNALHDFLLCLEKHVRAAAPGHLFVGRRDQVRCTGSDGWADRGHRKKTPVAGATGEEGCHMSLPMVW